MQKVSNGVAAFEDARWSRGRQKLVLRHALALPLVARGPVLDVGGGDGLFASLLAERRGFAVTVLDISPVAVRLAEERGIAGRVWDISGGLPFDARSFGTVCALDVLEHLYDPLSLLREMGRIGRDVVISVPNFNFIAGRVAMLGGRTPFQSKPQRGHVYWFNWTVLRRMARDAGMRVEAVSYGPILRFGAFGRFLARTAPNLFADSYVARLVPIHG